MKKKISMLFVVIFMLSLSLQVYAKDMSTYGSGSLCDCSISVGIVSNGIAVCYETGATTNASEIGCKDIVLQEKVDGKWRNINIPSGKTTNSTFYAGSAIYTGAVKGRAYRAHCTHYASFNGTVRSLYHECDSLVYN